MEQHITYIGLDVHKDTIAVAVAVTLAQWLHAFGDIRRRHFPAKPRSDDPIDDDKDHSG